MRKVERILMIVHTGSLDQLQAALPIVIPLLVAELALVIFCLVDLFRADRRVRGGSKLVWTLIILFISTLGPLLYLFWGRKDI
jgi:hypothetical protein